jgi:CO/xanthine dehydrogenase Mo-binding subunit
VWIETDDPYGPYGAKTLGEPTIIPTVAAVANAIYNSIGVRMRDLPITRERILQALGARA